MPRLEDGGSRIEEKGNWGNPGKLNSNKNSQFQRNSILSPIPSNPIQSDRIQFMQFYSSFYLYSLAISNKNLAHYTICIQWKVQKRNHLVIFCENIHVNIFSADIEILRYENFKTEGKDAGNLSCGNGEWKIEMGDEQMQTPKQYKLKVENYRQRKCKILELKLNKVSVTRSILPFPFRFSSETT